MKKIGQAQKERRKEFKKRQLIINFLNYDKSLTK